jgi:hypothetical protein
MRKITFFKTLIVGIALSIGIPSSFAATPYVMSTADYSESFTDIANWTNAFAAGTGASCWASVITNATGTIGDGVKTTATTATFATSATSGGVQRGSLTGNVAGTIVLLSTGASDNISACAIDLLLDFTGRNAGTISFDWAAVANSTGDRKSTLKVFTSIDGTTFTELSNANVLNVANNVAASGTITTVTLPSSFNNSATARIRFYEFNATGGTTGSRAKISIDNIAITSTPTSVVTVASPVFTPGTGTYFKSQNVVLSSTTSGASIYYTTNGDTPDNSGTGTSTLYTTPITVNSTQTIKAIAYKSGATTSSVTSAIYTLPSVTEVSSISTLRTSPAGTTTFYKLTGEAILTYKSATRNTKYIQDATDAVVIDDASGIITTGYNIGDGITGLIGTTALYNNMLQFTPAADPGTATSTGKTVSPATIALSELINNQGKLVKVLGVAITGTGNFAVSTSYNLNNSTSTVIRTQYADLDYITTPTAIPTSSQDITGVVLVYTTTAQLVPRSASDFANSTGATGIQDLKQNSISASNGKITLSATAGEVVEIYNAVGQKLISKQSAEGINTIAVPAHGVVLVKVGTRIAKVIL